MIILIALAAFFIPMIGYWRGTDLGFGIMIPAAAGLYLIITAVAYVHGADVYHVLVGNVSLTQVIMPNLLGK